jgi:putative toxin-antitoxin system antitoxin component (TIGR02293 family)
VAAGSPASTIVYAIVPSATFKRRTRLSPEESARTERLARVIALAEAAWEDADAAREFLNRPHPLLHHETPLAVAQSELGARMASLASPGLERNVLINQRHPEFARVKTSRATALVCHPRLLMASA